METMDVKDKEGSLIPIKSIVLHKSDKKAMILDKAGTIHYFDLQKHKTTQDHVLPH